MRKAPSAVAILVAAAFALLVAGLSLFGAKGAWVGVSVDGVPYLETARGFFTGDLSAMSQYRPGYLFSLAALSWTRLDPILAGRIHTALFSVIFAVCFLFLLRRIFGLAIAAFVVALLVSAPFFLEYSRSVSPPIQTTALLVVAMLFISRLDFSSGADLGWAPIGAAVFLSLAFTSHPAVLFYVAPLTCGVLFCFFYFGGPGGWSASARRSFSFLAAMGMPILLFEVVKVLLICSGRYNIPEQNTYLYNLFHSLFRLAPAAAHFSPVSDAPPTAPGAPATPAEAPFMLPGFGQPMESRSWTFFELARLFFGASPVLWVLLAVGTFALLPPFCRRRNVLFLFPLCAIIPLAYWGLVPSANRSRDVFYSFPGLYFAVAAGFFCMAKALTDGAPARMVRWNRAAFAGLCLLAGVALVSRLAQVPTRLATPDLITELAEAIQRVAPKSVSLNGFDNRPYAKYLKWELPASVHVMQVEPGSHNEDCVVMIIDGPERALVTHDLISGGEYRVIFHGRLDSTYPTALLKTSIPTPAPASKGQYIESPGNRIEDGGFEGKTILWQRNGDGEVSARLDSKLAFSGSQSLAVTFPDGYRKTGAALTFPVDVDPNCEYILQGYMTSDNSMRIFPSNEARLGATVDVTPYVCEPAERFSYLDWNRVRVAFTTGPDTRKCLLWIGQDADRPNDNPAFTVHFDEITLRKVPAATRVLSSGAWRIAWDAIQAIVLVFLLARFGSAIRASRELSRPEC